MNHHAVEVTHLLGEAVLGSLLTSPDQAFTVGSGVDMHWRLLGHEVGRVPAALAPVLRLSPPLWSEVEPAPVDPVFVPRDWMGGAESHTLLHPGEGGPVVRVRPDWTGTSLRDGVSRDLRALVDLGAAWEEDGCVCVPLRAAGEVSVRIGEATLRLRLTRPDAAARSRVRFDRPFLAAATVCLTLGVGTAWLVGTTELHAAAVAPTGAPDRMVEALALTAPPPPEPVATTAERKGASSGPGRPRAGAGGGDSGTDGPSSGPRDPFAALDAHTGLDAGIRDGIAGLIGAHATAFGQFDLGGRRGLGGGEMPTGPGGPGGLAQRGIGGPGDLGPGGDLGPRKSAGKVSQPSGEAIVLGSIDAALIDAAIKRKLSAIRYCYSRELQRHPDLHGKLSVKFTIGGDGSVGSAGVKTSSLGNDRASQCVVDQVRSIRFPEPKGGGTVIVSYPFLFSPG